jgi:2-keto-3-deoxy-6-phosphogluconate aldolase
MRPEEIRDRLIAERVVPVLRLASAELTERAVQCLIDVGFGAIEITMTTPGALALIRKFSARKIIIGAGTVLDLKTARDCIDAGAQFLVDAHVGRRLLGCSSTGHVGLSTHGGARLDRVARDRRLRLAGWTRG